MGCSSPKDGPCAGGVQRAPSSWVGISQLGELCQLQERTSDVLMEPLAARALAWEEGREPVPVAGGSLGHPCALLLHDILSSAF